MLRLFGALLFYISDIYVAHKQFVVGRYVDGLVRFPLYYLAQLIIDISIWNF